MQSELLSFEKRLEAQNSQSNSAVSNNPLINMAINKGKATQPPQHPTSQNQGRGGNQHTQRGGNQCGNRGQGRGRN